MTLCRAFIHFSKQFDRHLLSQLLLDGHFTLQKSKICSRSPLGLISRCQIEISIFWRMMITKPQVQRKS